MKLWLWKNGSSDSDFSDTTNITMPESSDAHSGGIVVLAETKEEAIKLTEKYIGKEPIRYYDVFEDKEGNSEPIEIPLDKKGVVIFARGDC